MLRKYARAHTSSTVKVSIIPDIGDLSSAFSVSGNLISTLVATMRGTVPCVRKGSAICFVWHLLQRLSFLSSVLPLAFLFTTVPLILLLPLLFPCLETRLSCPDSVFPPHLVSEIQWMIKVFAPHCVGEKQQKELQDMAQIMCGGLLEQLFTRFRFVLLFSFFFFSFNGN